MFDFDTDNTIENFLASEDEIDLTAKQWRFKQRVNGFMTRYNMTRDGAEALVETVIRTKETNARCACGAVAQSVVKDSKEIVCGSCRITRGIDRQACL